MAYEGFAYIYDDLMEHAPYDAWVEFTETMLTRYQKQSKTIMDLGCGTGEITLRLAHAGYSVTGVDYSSDMLSCAMEKSIAQNTSVRWIQQDITMLTGFKEVDVCVSYCDVMNYILCEKELETVFQHVLHSLKADGLFIFDIHDPIYAKKDLIGHTFAEVTDDLAYIWDCEQGEEEEMNHYLTFFQKDYHRYIRFDEMHQQKLYDRDTMKDKLISCGFTKVEFYLDFNTDKVISSESGERIFILAQK